MREGPAGPAGLNRLVLAGGRCEGRAGGERRCGAGKGGKRRPSFAAKTAGAGGGARPEGTATAPRGHSDIPAPPRGDSDSPEGTATAPPGLGPCRLSPGIPAPAPQGGTDTRRAGMGMFPCRFRGSDSGWGLRILSITCPYNLCLCPQAEGETKGDKAKVKDEVRS